MITISLCMIVKNEEKVLSRCLDSVKEIVDEIIIIDTGSTDKTKEIAKKYTNKVLDFKWINDFSAARNYSFSFASMDYVLWLDADDVILNKDKEKLLELKKKLNKKTDFVMMKYDVGFDEILSSIYRAAPQFQVFFDGVLKVSVGTLFLRDVHHHRRPAIVEFV